MEGIRQQDAEDEAYFSADGSDVGSVGSDVDDFSFDDIDDGSFREAERVNTLSRHLQHCDLSQTKHGRVIICDRFSRFLHGGFEFRQGSGGYAQVLVPTLHHGGDSFPDTEGCPVAPRQTSYQDCEIGVRFKDCKYGDDLGVQPSEHVFLSITRATIPPGLFNKLFSDLAPAAIIDVKITGANAERVKRLMEEVGFKAEILYEVSIPAGSRLAQELETGDVCTQDDLITEDDEGIYDKLLAWAAGGTIPLCVVRGCVPQKKRSAIAIAGDCPEAKRIRGMRKPREPRTNRGADLEDTSPRYGVGKV